MHLAWQHCQSSVMLKLCVSACLTSVSTPGRESFPGAALSPQPRSHHLPPSLAAHSRQAPSTRPTSLPRYFLRKTYHLRLDRSADYAETAAAPAHNPPQASTSLSLPFSFSRFQFHSFLVFSITLSFYLSLTLFLTVSVFFSAPHSLSYCLRTESRYNQWAEINHKSIQLIIFTIWKYFDWRK